MTDEEIKKQVLSYKWEHWGDRPFGAFVLSLFKLGQTREYMRRIGVDAEWPAAVFQKGAFYRSEEVWDLFVVELEAYLQKGGSLYEVVAKCENYGEMGKREVQGILRLDEDPISKLKALHELLTQDISYVWLAHGFEHLYIKKLREEIPKYFKGDTEKIMGDICFPVKKNAHALFEAAIRGDQSLEKIHEKFSWIKARDGFSPGFTLEELRGERERVAKTKEHHDFIRPEIPTEMAELAKIAQELVYFRTLRTDILWELMYLARPILEDVAKKYTVPFESLRDYSIFDLVSGNLEFFKYGEVTMISKGEEFALLHESVVIVEKLGDVKEFKGTPAFKGKVTGPAKIVMKAQEIGKVNEGDILIAPTTAPSYILGMKRAAGFVTDEGGITSHAAIVAREMKKPCIIGTKIGTRVLKDGDLIEVDATNGKVKVLAKAV